MSEHRSAAHVALEIDPASADGKSAGRSGSADARVVAARVVSWLMHSCLDVARGLLFTDVPPDGAPAIHRVLVRRPANLGDAVVVIPALSALRQRFPNAHITVLTGKGGLARPGIDDVLGESGLYDELVVAESPARVGRLAWIALLRRLRERRYEVFVELPPALAPFSGQLKQLVFARAIGCRHAAGFQVATISLFARAQVLEERPPQEVDRLCGVLRPLGMLVDDRQPRLTVSASDRAHAVELLASLGVRPGESLVAVNPGAKREMQRWPADRFASVARSIAQTFGCRIIVTGNADEKDLAERLVASVPGDPIVLAGKTSVRLLAAILERCRLLVSNDTGTMHLAAAVGTPVVAVFSARSRPNRWYPYGSEHVVLRHDVPCSPCELEACPNDLICLHAIEPEHVLGAVARVLAPIPLTGAAAVH